jgi:hypothetical protein
VSVTPFEAYRQQIESLLQNTEQLLTESERDSLRMAIAGARKEGIVIERNPSDVIREAAAIRRIRREL